MTTEHTRPTVTMKPDQRLSWSLDAKGDPWSGQSLKARYQLAGRLLSGASGDLYRAHDGETGADVTIKLLTGPVSPSDDMLRGLRDELLATRAIARIRPNVAVVRDCDRTEEGQSFVVLEPLEGRTLASVLRQDGPLGVERALRLALQVAEGLQAAHSLVLVHGALGAEHVLVGAHDAVKIIGFEVARLATRGSRPGGSSDAREGIVAFRPGQLGELSERADVKAVGALLIDMLTAGADGGRETRAARSAGGPEIPAPVKALIAELQSDDPARDGLDMGAAANALWVELHRTSEPTLTRVLRPARVVWSRTPWRAATVGVLVGAGVTLAGWVAYGVVIGGFSFASLNPGKPQSADTRVASPDVPAVGVPAAGGRSAGAPASSSPSARSNDNTTPAKPATPPDSSSEKAAAEKRPTSAPEKAPAEASASAGKAVVPGASKAPEPVVPGPSKAVASTPSVSTPSVSTAPISTPPASTHPVAAPSTPSASTSSRSIPSASSSPTSTSPSSAPPSPLASSSRTSSSPASAPPSPLASSSPTSSSPASAPPSPLASSSPASAPPSPSAATSPPSASGVTKPSPPPSRSPVEAARPAPSAAAARRPIESGPPPSNRASGPSAASPSPAPVTAPPVVRSPAPPGLADVTGPTLPPAAPPPPPAASTRTVAPTPQSTPPAQRQERRSEPDPSAIIDWLVNEYPRQQR